MLGLFKKKGKERLRSCHRLKDTNEIQQLKKKSYLLNCILEQKKDICGKIDELQTKSVV